MKKIYFAGPLFTMAEKQFNIDFTNKIIELIPEINIILPQERAPSLLNKENGFYLVFQDCLAMIDEADLILAILDGPDADSGTSVELGYAYAIQKPIIGIRTDFRISEDRGLNLMLSNICTELILDVNSNISELAEQVAASISGLDP